MLKSILASTLILFCTTIIESSILSNIPFLYIVPDLVLMCSVYYSMLNGKVLGQTTGFISGLFLDFITGVPFGFNCLFRTIIGYVYGFFANSIIITGIIMPILTVGIATLLKYLLILIITLFFPSIHSNGIISYDFLFEFIENIVLAPFIFKFLSLFKHSLSIITTKDKVDNV